MSFDLEKARDLATNPIHCPETDEIFVDAIAEIERLRGELASANVELLAAGELVTQLKRVREAEIDQAGAAERMYLEGVRAKDVRIKELEQCNAWLKADREFAYDELTAKIKELEDALVEERASRVYYEDSCPFRPWNDIKLKDKFLEKAKWQLQRGGKIRPNAKQHDHTAEFFRPNESPAKSWQITDERRRALSEATTFLPEEYGGDTARIRNVLRGMLKEAERE